MAHSKTSRFRISKCKRGTQAVNLRLKGLTMEEIGREMGVSAQRAWKIVADEFAMMTQKRTEAASQLAQIELARLEEAHKALYAKVQKGDVAAIGAMVKLCERRAKLLGLDVADKNAAPAGTVVLSIQEIVVQKREELAHGDGRLYAETDSAAPRPAAIPSE